MILKRFFINLIDFYQKHISVFTKRSCVFYPTCSAYAREAIEKYGALRGAYLALRRVLRCHPWAKNHIDPVP